MDLGAASGRVALVEAGPDRLRLCWAHRFPNRPVQVGDRLHWDILALYRQILKGLRLTGQRKDGLDSVGVDSWAVDYGLLDATGQLLGNPVHYRDGRTHGVAERVAEFLDPSELYQVTGVQRLPFNTAYQLVAEAGSPQWEAARTLLLIPDLIGYWLTGQLGAERTNASTTQLYDVRAQAWSAGLAERLAVPDRILPRLRDPGELLGPLLPGVGDQTGLAGSVPVTTVGSHDTASAVVALPARGSDHAYISCGTWSLVGVELESPVLTEASRLANFSNETGVGGRIRYLRNVMGLWLLQESLRTWAAAGHRPDLTALLKEAGGLPPLTSLVDPDDPGFLAPGDLPGRIAQACRASGQPAPTGPAQTVRTVLDSLAVAYRRAIRQVQELSGREVRTIHLVGGGVRNTLLCQLTADACGIPVVAGPAAATALGNALVQAGALGVVPADLDSMRALVRESQRLVRYQPTAAAGSAADWAAAEARVYG